MSELLVMARAVDGAAVIGLSRLATHTYVRSGMLLYHMPRCKLLLELAGEKNPRAKSPPLEMSSSLGKSGFVCVSWSLDLQNELDNSRIKILMHEVAIRLSWIFLVCMGGGQN